MASSREGNAREEDLEGNSSSGARDHALDSVIEVVLQSLSCAADRKGEAKLLDEIEIGQPGRCALEPPQYRSQQVSSAGIDQRICRAWMVNDVLIAAGINYVWLPDLSNLVGWWVESTTARDACQSKT